MLLKIVRWMFLVYVVSIPLVQPLNFYLFGLQLQPADLIFAATFAIAAAGVVFGKFPLVWNRQYIVFGLYGAAFFVSMLFSGDSLRSLEKLAGVFYLVAIAVLTINLALDRQYPKRIIVAIVVGTALTAVAALSGVALFYAGFDSSETNFLLSHLGSLPSGNYPRVQALFANANMMCNFLNVGLIAILIARRSEWIGPRIATVLITATWIAVIFTLSPGIGGVILSAGLWYFFVHRTASPQRRSMVLAGAVFAALFFLSASIVSLDTPNTDRDLDIPVLNVRIEPSVRVLVWRDAISNFSRSPIIGNGAGTDAALVTYTTLSGKSQILRDAHNMWLNVAAQTGLVGILMLALLTISTWSLCCSGTNNDDTNIILNGFCCMFVGAFVYQGLTGSFEDARHIWLILGLIAAVALGREPARNELIP
ncbi:MAG: O-antigen ligase family protein [Acidobacteriota bacterium]